VINQKRVQLNLRALPVHVFKMVKDETGKEIHSDRIRAGKINREGRDYQRVLQKTVLLNQQQRKKLQLLKFPLVRKPNPQTITCVVGDQALKRFRSENWPYQIGIFDHYIQRKKDTRPLQLKPDFLVKNKAGEISLELSKTLKNTINKNNSKPLHIFVKGEEDLAAVALTLFLPLGSNIYFGQPNQGLALCNVTEEIKNQLLGIVSV